MFNFSAFRNLFPISDACAIFPGKFTCKSICQPGSDGGAKNGDNYLCSHIHTLS